MVQKNGGKTNEKMGQTKAQIQNLKSKTFHQFGQTSFLRFLTHSERGKGRKT